MADAVAIGKEIIPGGRDFLLLPRPSLKRRRRGAQRRGAGAGRADMVSQATTAVQCGGKDL
jgi:hypothetical protein